MKRVYAASLILFGVNINMHPTPFHSHQSALSIKQILCSLDRYSKCCGGHAKIAFCTVLAFIQCVFWGKGGIEKWKVFTSLPLKKTGTKRWPERQHFINGLCSCMRHWNPRIDQDGYNLTFGIMFHVGFIVSFDNTSVAFPMLSCTVELNNHETRLLCGQRHLTTFGVEKERLNQIFGNKGSLSLPYCCVQMGWMWHVSGVTQMGGWQVTEGGEYQWVLTVEVTLLREDDLPGLAMRGWQARKWVQRRWKVWFSLNREEIQQHLRFFFFQKNDQLFTFCDNVPEVQSQVCRTPQTSHGQRVYALNSRTHSGLVRALKTKKTVSRVLFLKKLFFR